MKQTERKVGDVIYIDVDKSAKIYAIGSDGNDVRYYYTYKGVRNFIYEKQCFLLEELHSNLMKQTQDKWVFNFEENQLETQDGKVITVIDEHHGSLKDINLIASAPEMLEALYNAQDALYRSGGDQKDIQAIWAVINNAEGGE